MREIKLTQGKNAIVDDEDFEYLNQFKWRILKAKHTYYAIRHKEINGKDTNVYMHREIKKQSDNKINIDHKDGDGLNNQKNNLRICNQSQNCGNSNKQCNNTSGYKGVFYHKYSKKYQVQIMHNNKLLACGYFNNKVEAALVYDKKARELFGEFAKTNFINVEDWT